MELELAIVEHFQATLPVLLSSTDLTQTQHDGFEGGATLD